MKPGMVVLLLSFVVSCTSSETAAPPLDSVPFEDISQTSGLEFWQYSGATGKLHLPEIAGSGAAMVDYDNDGDVDVYLVQGAAAPEPGEQPVVPLPEGWKAGNRLFRNELVPSGKLIFTDVTEQAGVGYISQGMGVAAGDFDNDGFPDLYVTNYNATADDSVLYHNNGDGSFTDVTREAGVLSSGWPTSAAFLDYDKDGSLDLAVVHYVRFYPRDCPSLTSENEYCGPQNFQPTVTELFHNRGDGRFENITAKAGLKSKPGPGLGILTGDFNSDSWPDFMVANDGAANHLWLNEPGKKQPGTRGESVSRVFKETGLKHGIAYASDGRPRAGMGLTIADIYGDGGESVVVTNLIGQGFTLFSRQPNGNYMDVTRETGMFRSSRPYTGFGVGFFDMDNSGLADLFAANGAVEAEHALLGTPFPYGQRNMLVHNLGKGKGFEDLTDSAGEALEHIEVSRAAVFGDVNNDGGLDILVTNNNGPARLLLNTVPQRGHWLLVHAEGAATNRSAYGSVVKVFRENGTSIRRRVRSDGSYLSANDPRVHFGLGAQTEINHIEIQWLGGACESWTGIQVDQIVTLREGSGGACTELYSGPAR